VGATVGLGVGVAVGLGVGWGVGFGVGTGVGFGVLQGVAHDEASAPWLDNDETVSLRSVRLRLVPTASELVCLGLEACSMLE
jgi:hypothetical protein